MAVEFTAHAQNFGSFGIFGRRKAQVRMPDKLYGASSLVAPTVPPTPTDSSDEAAGGGRRWWRQRWGTLVVAVATAGVPLVFTR